MTSMISVNNNREERTAVPEKYRATLHRLLEASTADATRRAYRGQLRRFSAWCDDNGLCPLPAAPETGPRSFPSWPMRAKALRP